MLPRLWTFAWKGHLTQRAGLSSSWSHIIHKAQAQQALPSQVEHCHPGSKRALGTALSFARIQRLKGTSMLCSLRVKFRFDALMQCFAASHQWSPVLLRVTSQHTCYLREVHCASSHSHTLCAQMFELEVLVYRCSVIAVSWDQPAYVFARLCKELMASTKNHGIAYSIENCHGWNLSSESDVLEQSLLNPLGCSHGTWQVIGIISLLSMLLNVEVNFMNMSHYVILASELPHVLVFWTATFRACHDSMISCML